MCEPGKPCPGAEDRAREKVPLSSLAAIWALREALHKKEGAEPNDLDLLQTEFYKGAAAFQLVALEGAKGETNEKFVDKMSDLISEIRHFEARRFFKELTDALASLRAEAGKDKVTPS